MKEAKTIYEQLGGTYREENGNLVPDVELPEQANTVRCILTISSNTVAEGTPLCLVKDG